MIQGIEFNSDGFDALLGSDAVREMIQGYTDEVKAEADAYIVGDSEGFNANVKKFGVRPVGLVGTTDMATMIAASEQKALQKAVNA